MNKYFDGKHLFGEPMVEQHGNNVVMTNVMKQLKRKIICLDTKLCDDLQYYNGNFGCATNTTTNINITLPERINEVKSIKVKNVELPISMTNISSALGNNVFKITNNTTSNSYTIVIADGEYTSTTLATEINSKITSSGAGNV